MTAQIYTTAIARAHILICPMVEQRPYRQVEPVMETFWHLIQIRKSLKFNIDLVYLGQKQMLGKVLQGENVTIHLPFSIKFLFISRILSISKTTGFLGTRVLHFTLHYLWAGSPPHKYVQHLLPHSTSCFPNLNQYSFTPVEGTPLI